MQQAFSLSAVPGCLVRPRRWRVALLVGLALSVGLVSRVPAATTWTVCASGCNYTSIKAAIAASTTRNGDTLAIAAGTYTEAGITVNKSLTLQGEDADTTIVQAAATPGTASTRVFTIAGGVTVTLWDLTIRHGSAVSYVSGNSYLGGGLFNEGTLTLLNRIVSGNTAISGGGLFNDEGTLTLINSTVRDNAASLNGGGGGGLFNQAGTLTLTNSTVSGNAAYAAGGLCNNMHAGRVTLTNSTISDNIASNHGGGLLNEGPLTLTNSTVSGNIASNYGGGLYNGHGPVTLTASTISGNAASHGSGLVSYGWLTLATSIVANNPHGGDCLSSPDWLASHGYNLDSDGSCLLTASTDLPGVDPLLGPLQDNGGPTFTHALLPGSPAIDAIPWGTKGCGTTLVSDQRWQARPHAVKGACDIGAYEVEVAGQALSGWVTGLTPQTVTCKDVTTGQVVTLNDPATSWDCEAAGSAVTSGDQVSMRAQGPVEQGATDVGGAVTGMAPSRGGCTNLTTGQQVQFQHMVGATAASCVAAGLVVYPGDTIQISVQGAAE
jgi:hypothetical protein